MKYFLIALAALLILIAGYYLLARTDGTDPSTDFIAPPTEEDMALLPTPPAPPMIYEGPDNESLTFQETNSGLSYAVIQESDSDVSPSATDTVVVHYHGTLDDGEVFDSSYMRGEPIEFPLDGVIAGWTEGVPLMTVGSIYRFIIPADLAYGPAGGMHPLAGETLTFDVELLEVK
jgi:hypothetical protein